MEWIYASFFLAVICCSYVEAQGRQCPEDCYCNNKFVDCLSLMDFPHDLALDTQRVRLSHMNIGEIPKHAFSYLPNLTLIEIEQSNVGYISGCAFMNIPSLKTLVFDKTVVGSIESYAFNSMSKMQRIEFFKSRIGRLKAFALYKLSDIININFIDTNIQYFYSNALYGISNITSLDLVNNNVSDIVTDAFREVQVDSLQMTENSFWNMHCGVLDVIFRSADSFVFRENTFYCNCSIYWLLSTSGQQIYKDFLNSNRCHGPGKLNETLSLSHVTFSDLNCKKKKENEPLKCDEIKHKILNPTCDARHRHPAHASGDTHDDGSDGNGGNSLTAATLIFYCFVSFLSLKSGCNSIG